jgi:hypothetical protein
MIDPVHNPFDNDQNDRLAREIIQEQSGEKNPELALIDDFLEEIDMRLEQVKVYYPIMDMLRKRKQEESFSKLVPELVFLLLSYLIYEGKLKYKGITFHNLENFLTKAMKVILKHELKPEESRELTADILDGLQNGGRNFILSTYSVKTGNLMEKFIKFLDIKQSEDGTLQYYITEQGVDFYLRTKEFPEETKITINLLLFQRQMEKGIFGFAYETVRRLNMEVQKKRDRKYSLLEALMYSRLDFGEDYNNYHKSIDLQFDEEAELFNTAVKNVGIAFNEYVERINSDQATEKELRSFTLIKIIEKEIGRAQTLHTELLKEAVSFTKEYDQALSVRRKAIFTERFNFQGEFEKLLTHNERPEVIKYLFEPLLTPNVRKNFNPLRAFETQRVARGRQEEQESQGSDIRVDRETIDVITSNRVKKNFIFYAKRLLEALDTLERQVNLQDFCANLVDKYSKDSVYNGDFLSFIIEMNRDKEMGADFRLINFSDSKIQMDEEMKTVEEVFLKAAISGNFVGKISRITVKSFPEQEMELLPGLKVTNMLFIGENTR